MLRRKTYWILQRYITNFLESRQNIQTNCFANGGFGLSPLHYLSMTEDVEEIYGYTKDHYLDIDQILDTLAPL